jgi:hypothetical protein
MGKQGNSSHFVSGLLGCEMKLIHDKEKCGI